MFLTKSEIDLHLDIAQRVSRESNIDKAKVGCVNLYANGMVSFGWNQLPNDRQFDNDDGRLHSIHAETAASQLAWVHGIATKYHYKFITQEPCLACAKQAFAEGATGVIFEAPYGIVDGIRYLCSHYIDVVVRVKRPCDPDLYYQLSDWYENMPSNVKWLETYKMYGIPLFADDAK